MSVTYVISDPEGLSPSHLFPLYPQVLEGKEKLIICGDILDSTAPSIDFGKLDSDFKTKLFKLKSNNIRNILDIVVNDNISIAFGNRDLNKLKVLPLTRLEINSTQGNIIQSFNNGTQNINLNGYFKIKNIINKQWSCKMSNWYPFWGGAMDKPENKKYWKNDEQLLGKGFFEDRFIKIFGVDTAQGTMSAQNLKYTIVKELGLYDITQDILDEVRISRENYNLLKEDYFSFVVLAVFRSMLLPGPKIDKNSDIYNFFYFSKKSSELKPIQNHSEMNQNMFRGLLHSMFMQKKNNMILTQCIESMLSKKCTEESSTFLFSHGGVSKEIIQFNTIQEIKNILISENSDITTLKNIITNAQMTGGFYKKLDSEVVVNDILTPINNFNRSMKEVIQNILKESDMLKPSNDMLVLLIASATFECAALNNKFTAGINCDNVGRLKENSDSLSTMSGIKKLREKNNVFFHKDNLYNIFGHNPNGFGTSISLYERKKQLKKVTRLDKVKNFLKQTVKQEQGDNKTYLVNLDSSNTFIGTSLNASIINTELKTSSYIKIHNNDIEMKTHIYIVTTPEQKFDIPTTVTENTDILLGIKNTHMIAFNKNSNHFTNEETQLTEINIDNTINEQSDILLRMVKDNNKIFYHGIVKDYVSVKDHVIFTYFIGGFSKCICIMEKNEFVNYFMKNEYKQKYLKYKAKYMELKNKQLN